MALENIVSEVDLDVYDHDKIVPGIKAISGDSVVRYVRANLYQAGEVYTIDDENVTVKLHALRPDRTLIIGSATYNRETYLISPEYIPVVETEGGEETIERWYYIDGDGNKIYVDGPDDAPEGYTAISEATSGDAAVPRYYYIDQDGNRIEVDSPDPIPAVYGTSYELYAEMTKEMLAVPGTVQMQFKITVGDQILKTSKFTVSVGESLERNPSGTIDLTLT